MAVKPTKHGEYKEVTYSDLRWQQLKELREKAVWVMAALEAFHLQSLTHGSIARGDVKAAATSTFSFLKSEQFFGGNRP